MEIPVSGRPENRETNFEGMDATTAVNPKSIGGDFAVWGI
jgi:hypothetical protein